MKKRLIVAVATSLVLANGASVAFADTGSQSGSKNKDFTIAGGWEYNKLTDAQKDAYKSEREAYIAKLEVIHATFRTAMSNAEKAFRTALESATTDEARASAQVAFRAAGAVALTNYQNSLVTLGLPPVKPELSDEQKDAKKDAKKAEIAAFKAKRVVIMAAFHTAMESARDTFKTAKQSATTDDAKNAAQSAFKTAVSNATQTKTDALKALGFKSSN